MATKMVHLTKMAINMATKMVHFPRWSPNWQLKWYIFQDGHLMATAMSHFPLIRYSKACVKWPFYKRLKIGLQDLLSLNAGQNNCRMHFAITFLSFIRLPIVIKIFVLPIFECFTQVLLYLHFLLIRYLRSKQILSYFHVLWSSNFELRYVISNNVAF